MSDVETAFMSHIKGVRIRWVNNTIGKVIIAHQTRDLEKRDKITNTHFPWWARYKYLCRKSSV